MNDEIKDEIIEAFVAKKKRQPTSHEVWVRYFADPRVIATQARAIVELAALRQYHISQGGKS